MNLLQSGGNIAPSKEQRELVVRRSSSLWLSLREATSHQKPPTANIPDISQGLRQVPSFTETHHKTHATSTSIFLFAKGTVTWSTTDASGCAAPSSLGKTTECSISRPLEEDFSRLAETRELEQSFLLGIRDATPCSIDESHGLRRWPGSEGDYTEESNYVTVLALAWAYILSSLWVESQNGRMRYTDEKAPVSSPSAAVDGGTLAVCSDTPPATRCDIEYQPPWATRLTSSMRLTIYGPSGTQPTTECPGSYQSFTYLRDFCLQRDLVEQAKAALAAALMFPSHAHLRVPLALPAPMYMDTQPSAETETSQLQSQALEDSFKVLPNLMTISSAATGITAALCSVFFEPSIPCNLCSEWLEPFFTIISSLDTRQLTAMCMLRRPSIGGWWLGSAITGLHRYILQEARSGTPLVNLPSWWWTQVPQSYLCSPCLNPIDGHDSFISRQKEAVLLYLSQDSWSYSPPWKPPGKVTINDSHIVVQEHARCTGHFLSYLSWSWLTADGFCVPDAGYSSWGSAPETYDHSACSGNVMTPDLGKMSQEASKACSRMIFWGLWQQGSATHDRELYQSLKAWIDMSPDSEDDSEEDDLESGDSIGKPENAEKILNWLVIK
ncbi:conserved hypothetical protein [Microsporum canis CBS 113480]|uniref:Uncharacterized protein n=1 Tax=Arthroderma otae (strain ATCC MYA-4605 / CBS 113480) TaxID=554155 RepID=C5FEU9_ARTOC|nr:conserved hypothetical protein [Microsporum canis CBS 113480]EEQ28243.1 conserved hypothetical protein [Microsporum canis CBS 113480]